MIASKLKKENPLWHYTGQQCEDKFKGLRKHYVKARDENEKKSGLPVATCKFYKEMDNALGDKPAVKPVSIASTLRKHKSIDTTYSSNVVSVCLNSSSKDDSERDSTLKSKKRKKNVTKKNIERLLTTKKKKSNKKKDA
ncbi:uncharacterized protein LOC120358172 [Solenopsis invicta]|nr:uncharacterized protein LOC120358172 [Solenopsis invicta]